MRISVKGRYALASMIVLAKVYDSGEKITVTGLYEDLGFSKKYTEQVFSLLKRAGLVKSNKGSQGGYRLSKNPKRITAYDILYAVENLLFEKTENTVTEKAPDIEIAMRKMVVEPLDERIKSVLSSATLMDLINESEKNNDNYMFYI